MKPLQERTCPGISLTAAYWADTTAVPELSSDPGLAAVLAADVAEEAAAVAAALNARCAHPVYLVRKRRKVR